MRHERIGIKKQLPCLLLGTLALYAVPGVATAEAPKGGSIAYVLTAREFAVYSDDDFATLCPDGVNDGQREVFDKLFPKDSGKQFTVLDTRLAREGLQYNITTAEDEDPFPFFEAQGNISYGLNLDGKIGPNDLQSPTGEKGVDNQMFRVLGCVEGYRKGGSIAQFDTTDLWSNGSQRFVIELTNVDDLRNDDDVTVTTYRGLDRELYVNGAGDFAPGGVQRLDIRYGKPFIYQLHGKIIDGVLTTEPVDDFKLIWAQPNMIGGHFLFQGFRMHLDLSPTSAEGLLAGYADINQWNLNLVTNWHSHFQNYGRVWAPSLYHAMSRLADGYPDPVTGKDTAISSAVQVSFVKVNVIHSLDETQVARSE